MLKRSNIYVFIKAQCSAFLGGIVDYIIMVICTELLGIHYTISIVIGGIVGALMNFGINRYWTFQTRETAKDSMKCQLLKFATMVGGSIILKSSGTFLLSEGFRIDYRISRIVVDMLVSLGFNYTLQRYWVFRKVR